VAFWFLSEGTVGTLGTAEVPAFSGTEAQKARWFAAMRWRRHVESVLAVLGITFTQWLVLDALRELVAETEDAVSQNDVARRLELDRVTISGVMRTLERKWLVSRGIDITGRAWRVFLTDEADSLLREFAPAIEAISGA
jgi:DNA-binding MarR family transcriptional regulator